MVTLDEAPFCCQLQTSVYNLGSGSHLYLKKIQLDIKNHKRENYEFYLKCLFQYLCITGESKSLLIEAGSRGLVIQVTAIPTTITITVPSPENQWYDKRYKGNTSSSLIEMKKINLVSNFSY